MVSCSGSVIGGRSSAGMVRSTTGGRSWVCTGGVVMAASAASSSAPRSTGPVVSRSSDSDFRRKRRPFGASSVLVVLVVVVLVVVVVVAAQQAVTELAEPLGDLVDGRRGDDEQAEEGQQGEEDDGDDRADAGRERRADGPAEQPAGAVLARAGGRPGCRAIWAMPSTEAMLQIQPIASRPRASGRGPRRSRRRAVKNSTTGRAMTSEPTIQRTPSARATPTGPMPLLQAAAPSTIASPRTARPDPVAAVLGGERFGLLRLGDGAGEAAGAAGQQVPAPADDAPEAG